jgi:hypothetical protein
MPFVSSRVVTHFGFVAPGFRACVKTSCGETGRDPLTRPAPAGANASAGHPVPQGGEG